MAADAKTQAPKGVTAIFSAPDGRVIAHASDFSESRNGGLTLREAQEMRAKRALYSAAVRAMCNADMASAIREHQAEEIVQAMCRKHGHAVQVLTHGQGRND